MSRWPLALFIYAALGLSALWVSELCHQSAFERLPGWLGLPGLEAHLYSLIFGGTLGLVVVGLTRPLTEKFGFGKILKAELTPQVRNLPEALLLPLALLSALGEELCFRALLTPWLGWVGQAAVFGAVHQLPGPARYIWATSAFVMGLGFGALYSSTGSLFGPLLAHFLINYLNLRLLREPLPPPPKARQLGGLLGSAEPR